MLECSGWLEQTYDTNHFHKPWTTNLKYLSSIQRIAGLQLDGPYTVGIKDKGNRQSRMATLQTLTAFMPDSSTLHMVIHPFACRELNNVSEIIYILAQPGICIQCTGVLDWSAGLECWTGALDWSAGLERWTGALDWSAGLERWTGVLDWSAGLVCWNGVLGSTMKMRHDPMEPGTCCCITHWR